MDHSLWEVNGAVGEDVDDRALVGVDHNHPGHEALFPGDFGDEFDEVGGSRPR